MTWNIARQYLNGCGNGLMPTPAPIGRKIPPILTLTTADTENTDMYAERKGKDASK